MDRGTQARNQAERPDGRAGGSWSSSSSLRWPFDATDGVHRVAASPAWWRTSYQYWTVKPAASG